MERPPLDLSLAVPALAGTGWRAVTRHAAEGLLGIREVRRVFQTAALSGGPPFSDSLRGLGIRLEVSGLERIPEQGAVCLVANHPLGGADALALGAMCETRRPDFHILANRMAASLPGVCGRCLPLSIMGNDAMAQGTNARTLRKALAEMRSGRCIAAFPSGEVARWVAGRGITEGTWSDHILTLARRSRAAVVPVRFHAEPPLWFHLIGSVHPLARSALIPRVALASRGLTLRATVGRPIDPSDRLLECAADLRAATLGIGACSE